MKKLLIGLCAACMLGASAIGYAANVTFVNNYDQPVTFIVSTGMVYYPAAGGTIEPGTQTTMTIGDFTDHTYFMAFPPHNSLTVSNCGHPRMPFSDVTIYATGMSWNHSFSCHYEPHG